MSSNRSAENPKIWINVQISDMYFKPLLEQAKNISASILHILELNFSFTACYPENLIYL